MRLSFSAVVATVAPEFHRRREVAREQTRMMATIRQSPMLAATGTGTSAPAYRGKFYAAARPGANRPAPPLASNPNDYHQVYERLVMIRYAQQMEEDIPYIESILSDFETYVVGDLRYVPATGNEEADKLIREHLEWRFAECDYARELDLTGIARLCIRSKKRDGEVGAAYVYADDAIKLGLVEADCIGNPMMLNAVDANDYNGIVVDPASGAKVTFRLWRRTKANNYVKDADISANQFIHYYDKFRSSQKHGITAFRNGITRAIDIEQTIAFTVQNIKYRSSQLPAIQNENGKPPVGASSGYAPAAGLTNANAAGSEIDIDGVRIPFMKLTDGYVEYPNDFPNANFRDVTGDLKGDVALGVHLPPEFCFRSEAGGVLQRFYIEKAQRTFDEEKREIKRVLLNPFKNRTLRQDVDSGVLNLDAFPGLAASMNLYKGQWHMGRSVSTDYGHDTDSDIKLIDSNLMSPEEHAADNARDLAEIRQSKKKRAIEILTDATEVAKATGRTFEEALPFIQKQFPNAPAAPAAAAPDPDEEDDEEGEGAAAAPARSDLPLAARTR